LGRSDKLFADFPELLCQGVTLGQFARLLLIAVSKVFACHSLQLRAQPYIASSCCSLKKKQQKTSFFFRKVEFRRNGNMMKTLNK
jgi:hypothetical protein